MVFKGYDEDEEIYKNVITFHDWTANGKTADINSIAYTINDPFDENEFNYFGHRSLFQENRFNFISNNPSKLQSTDYFFTMDGSTVVSVYSDVLNTAN